MTWQQKILKPTRFSVIVKVGGSLVFSDHVDQVRRTLETFSGSAVLVLTGGGKLDNLIEDYAGKHALSRRVFHYTTLLAQDQCALLLANDSEKLEAVTTIDEAERVIARGRVPVLMPSTLVMASDVFRYTNRFSSDTMSAWLAWFLGIANVLVVKSRLPPEPTEVLDSEFVDEVFHDFVAWSRVRATFATTDSLEELLGGMFDGMGRPLT